MNGSEARRLASNSSEEAHEIWLVGLDPSDGISQEGRRPIPIVSSEAFNHVTKVPLVLPVTSRGTFARTAGFAVSLAKTTGVVGCDQPRSFQIDAHAAAQRGGDTH